MIYIYKCKACSREFEEIQDIFETCLIKCPKCGKDALFRKIYPPQTIYKGSGFTGAQRGV